jgi:methyl-accepting chemotaxis protein
MKKMSVKTRLTAIFATLSAMVLLVSGLSLKALSDSHDQFSDFITGVNARSVAVQAVRTAVDRRAIAARNMALVTTPSDFEMEKAAEAQAQQDVTARLAKLNEMVSSSADASDEARRLVGEITRIETAYAPVAQKIVALAVANQRDEAVKTINVECRPLLAALIKATNAYAESAHSHAEQLVEQSAGHYATQRDVLIAACVAFLIIAVLAGYLITRDLLRALGAEPAALGDVSQRVASGDLRVVPGADAAPAGSVLASMGEMQRSLVQLIGQVRASADSIATGSSQIASGNVDLSSRTEQQAASLQETASSMEELTSTVRQNAENAQQASSLSNNASEVARKGNEVVGRVVGTMSEISDSSTRIAEITGMIEGIAFQTNILALNAAVEAARAGEQGRGFAVVASEVRSLAQRSSGAAKEIKELIGVSVQRIRDGSALANEAGKTMSDVTQAVARVTDIMGEIAAASSEQSRGIEQVNQAIVQMDQTTQQNAALVEQAAAAAKSLEDQGKQLNQSIAFFRLDATSSTVAADVSATERHAVRSASRDANVTRKPVQTSSIGDPEWATF